MDYNTLKDKVKKMGLRVTKNVKGKRVKLTHKELERKVSGLTLQNQARNATKFIRVCKMVLREAGPNEPRVQRVAQPLRMSPRRAAPPPPPPPPPMALNPRAALLANLKANLKKRGLAKN
jgi:hypothetical protein